MTVFSTHFMDEADILAGEMFALLLKDKGDKHEMLNPEEQRKIYSVVCILNKKS